MASAAVDPAAGVTDASYFNVGVDSIATVDLRLLSQSEIYALSLTSSSARSASSYFSDDIVIPKIDRSVFNESAGSRKQTFSRLRLASPSSNSSSSSTSTIRRRTPHLRHHHYHSAQPSSFNTDPGNTDNAEIVNILKELFVSKETQISEDALVSIPVEYSDPVPLNYGLDPTEELIGVKRKRGRPRKHEVITMSAPPGYNDGSGYGGAGMSEIVVYNYENVEQREKELANRDGMAVDLVALGGMEDPYWEEISKRTEGLGTEEGLLEYLKGLNGQWGSRRKKKRIVDASDFGNFLPRGWKLLLSLKKKDGRIWVYCRRYISPNGRQFVSCKEVSSYLLSLHGIQAASLQHTVQNNEKDAMAEKSSPIMLQTGDLPVQHEHKEESHAPFASLCDNLETKVSSMIPSTPNVPVVENLHCGKCSMTFNVKDDLLHHQLSCHKGKRSKNCQSITDGVLIKEGKYECQFCHKTFEERNRYNGHIGAHVRNQEKIADESSEMRAVDRLDCGSLSGVSVKESVLMQSSLQSGHKSVAESRSSNGQSASNCLIIEEGKYRSPFCHSTNLKSNDTESHTAVPVTKRNERANERSGTNMKGAVDLGCLGENCFREPMSQMKTESNLVADNIHANADNEFTCSPGDKCGSWNMNLSKPHDVMERVDEDTRMISRNSNLCLNSEAILSNDGNNSYDDNSADLYARKSAAGEISGCLNEHGESSASCWPIFNKAMHDAEKNVVKISAGTEENKKEEVSIVSLLSSRRNEEPCEIHADDGRFTCTMDELKPHGNYGVHNESNIVFCNSHDALDESSIFSVKQRYSSKEQSCINLDDVNGVISDAEMSEQKRTSWGSTLSPIEDKHPCLVGNVEQVLPVSVSEHKHNQTDEYGGRERTYYVNDDAHVIPSVVPSWKEQQAKVNDKEISASLVEEPRQQRGSDSSLLSLSSNEKNCSVENYIDNISTREKETQVNDVQHIGSGNLMFPFGNIHGASRVGASTSSKQDRSFEFSSLFPSANLRTFCAEDNINRTFNSAAEKLNQEASGMVLTTASDARGSSHKADTYCSNSSRNHELTLAFGDSAAKLGSEGNYVKQGSFSLRNSDSQSIEGAYSMQSSLQDLNHRTVNEPKQGRDIGVDLRESSFMGKMCELENNLNLVPADRVWEQAKINEVGNSGNKFMFGIGSRNMQPDGDIMNSSIWRNGVENVLQGCLTDNSSPLLQSSNCFRTYDNTSDKVEEALFRVNDDYGGNSGFEELRSSRTQPVEYSFMSTESSNSQPKDFLYGANVDQGLNSSFWLGKDNLMPSITRTQIASLCVWCRNEFFHDPVHSGSQTGAIGTICPSCSARMSGQFTAL